LKALKKKERLPLILGDHIKVGNSLISGSEEELKKYFGDNWKDKKPFNWEKEFKDVFDPNLPEDEGGFDVVIGNPPYVQLSMVKSLDEGLKNYLIENYKSSMGRLNTFGFFIKLGLNLLREGGYLGFIIPNTILTQDYYEELRNMILETCAIKSIISFEELPFKDAVVENVVLILERTKSDGKRRKNKIQIRSIDENLQFIEKKSITQELFRKSYKNSFNINLDEKSFLLKEKIETHTKKLSNFLYINQAIALKHERSKYLFDEKLSDQYKPVLDGRYINRYSLNWNKKYLAYDIKAIHSCKREDIFLSEEKLFFRRVGDKLIATYDNKKFYALNTLVVMNLKPNVQYNLKYFLAVFNSSLANFYYQMFLKSTKKVFSEIQAKQVAQLPIKIIDFSNSSEKAVHDELVVLVDRMLILNKKLNQINIDFNRYINTKPRISDAIFKSYVNKLDVNDKEVLNDANRVEGKIKEFEVSEEGEWLVFTVGYERKTKQGKIDKAKIRALKCRFKDEKLRKFLYYSIKAYTRAGMLGKGNLYERILKIKIPHFDSNPEKNLEIIYEIMEPYLKAVEEYNNIKKEIEVTDKTIDQKVYELYGLTNKEVNIVEGNPK
jgi:hypothetical protein